MGKTKEEQRDKIRNNNKIKNINPENTKIQKVEDIFFRGIYYLYLDNKIVYIGQSKTNVMQRISNHYNDPSKLFTSFKCTPKDNLSDKQLNSLEKKLIHKYSPKYNTTHRITKGRRSKSVPLVLR